MLTPEAMAVLYEAAANGQPAAVRLLRDLEDEALPVPRVIREARAANPRLPS
jgi:hypothetical protein